MRSSSRLRLGRLRHRRGRSVWTTSRERDGCDASSRSARRHRRWRDTISATLQISHRTRRAQRGTTPQRTPRDIAPAAPPRSGGPTGCRSSASRTRGGDAVDAAGGDGSTRIDITKSATRARRRAAAVRHRSASSPASRVDAAANRRARPETTLRHHADHMACARRRRRAARRAASSSNGPTSDPHPVSRLSPGQVEIIDDSAPRWRVCRRSTPTGRCARCRRRRRSRGTDGRSSRGGWRSPRPTPG